MTPTPKLQEEALERFDKGLGSVDIGNYPFAYVDLCRDFISQEISLAIDKTKEEILRRLEEIDEISTINTPTPYDVGEYRLILKDQAKKVVESV